ncbi:DUF4292 domain-containing protein [Sunxiuqinia indica]|uniref:DUF4292 domain-containing protein n=1 Tax=Sunxiuqinia indica TaxID=2692584 RepID=UPI0013568897|nr:DUF4292 domain-containing protein [Sunxiuqinia indica]
MKTQPLKQYATIIVLLVFAFTSCKTTKLVTIEKVKPISTNRLIKKIEDNSFDYDVMAIKRIACQYEGPNDKRSFRANLKSEKDKRMLLTLSKINVPIARLYLTPDSVKMVNYLDKSYLTEDYDYLSDFVNADLDFKMIQSIISNEAFSYNDGERDNDLKDFVSYIDSGRYVLQSLKNRKLNKILRKGNEDKIDRYLKKLDEDDFVIQRLFVDPKTFKIEKIELDDQSNNRKVTVDFSEFEKVNRQLYPGDIDIYFASPEKELSIKIKLSKFSTDKDQSFNFNIPDRYDRVKRP